jgi:L,D-peptidoglycan transpeptidase YkuD (ErfK/YbiS/YcfS/YnhG family)
MYHSRKTVFLFLCMLVPVLMQAQTVIDKYNSYLKSSNQVLFVTAPDWNATQGSMQLYSRTNKHYPWKLVNQFAVTLGRNGLAYDGHNILPRPVPVLIKHEGDGKSPAGIFSLGTVFSYHLLNDLKMPFKKIDTSDICVDDMRSSYYNTWVNTDTASHKDWNSFEHMKQNDDAYEYGVWVKYNSDKIFAGDGSCIFLHVWGSNTTPTSGCTAMEKQNMITIIHWLDDKQHPVLLQLVMKE